MPGIVGLVSRRPTDWCRETVERMVASMNYEPFYQSKTWAASEMGIYGGSVALDGSSISGGIYRNAQGGVTLLLSGECFGTAGGADESSGSWLVRLYEDIGEEFLGQVNGLFSGLLIDQRQGKAFLFNDRYGIERIYWHETGDATYFASEAKALLAVLPMTRAFDEEGVAQFLECGCTLEEKTLFRGIEALQGGAVWSFTNGKTTKGRYFCPKTWEAQPTLSSEEFELEFQETFTRILPRYFRAESRVGISLTGGLDTRMIMACRAVGQPNPICYTFAGKSGNTLDVRRAAEVAAACGLEHKILRVGDDFLKEFGSYVDRTIASSDGCAGVTGAHEIYFNRMARSLSPIRLTGNFGSEVLRGMSTFKPIGLDKELLADGIQTAVARAGGEIAASGHHPVSFAAFREIPWRLFGTLAAGRSQVKFRTPYLDNEVVSLAFRRPRNQQTSPLPALRFVNRNHPALAQIPTDRGQIGETRGLAWALRRTFSEVTFKLDYFHKEGLPGVLTPMEPVLDTLSRVGILGLHKFLPYSRWFRYELGSYVRDRLSDPRVIQSPFWNAAFIRKLAEDHISGRKNYLAEINAVLTLDSVERLLLNSP
jgi:asparagine synthase (glutamine-hydrolysing)